MSARAGASTGSRRATGSSSGALRYDVVDAGFARVLVAASERGVCLVSLGEREAPGLDRLEAWSRRHARGATAIRDERALRPLARQLAEYAAGARRSFDVELDLRGTEFELAVWRALREIPFGATETYGELARRIGRPGAARAVGAAAGRNPVPILVPCHRLVARGGIGGFTGGLEHKLRLLAVEGREFR